MRQKEKDSATQRVPPGQVLTAKFPVLTYGPVPAVDLSQWRFTFWGLIAEGRVQITWEQFRALPQSQVQADFHCVTRWSRLDNLWQGVLFRDLVKLVTPLPEVRYVMVHCLGGYSTNLPLAALLDDDVLLAHSHDGATLSPDHGWPLRLIVPKRYAWKSAKWVDGLEFMAQDAKGFWERYGYHNDGDPWREERFS
ncbi:MAG: sulfite oxidase-like oxidoreductase [Chloroflexi bacterium]|nr:sulfite oxidase-like oxidoreductase [Chloroflexota bacterium]